MRRLWRSIKMPSVTKKLTRKQRVLDYAASRGWMVIGEAEWKELHTSLPDISDSMLRSAGLPVEQPWLGVIQHTQEELEASLTEMARIYEARPDLRRYSREQVIAAKDRAKWLSRSGRIDQDKRQTKAEMAEWMLVWLDDPSMFEAWIRVRRRQMA
jgi:hypothetical protein